MYDIKCKKKYSLDLNIPDFSTRYLNLLNSYKMNILIIKEDFNNATFRYRGLNIYQSMKNNNKYDVNLFNVDELESIYDFLDKVVLVIVQRARWSFEIDSFVKIVKSKNINVVYDIDDMIYKPKYVPKYLNSISNYSEGTMNHMFMLSSRYEMLADLCDGFIVTTDVLKNYVMEDFNKPVWVFHNYLNLEQEKISKEIIDLKSKSFSNDKFIIGYFSGSPSHKRDLEIVEPALIKLMNQYSDIYLKIVGHMNFSSELKKFKDEGRIIMSGFVSFQELEYEIGQVDLNIVPLQKHAFNECKSELKYFESSIVNTLTCATNNNIYNRVIQDGVNGFLSDEISWYDKIEYIYLNYNKLKPIAETAREICLNEYGNKKQEKNLEKLYDDILDCLK